MSGVHPTDASDAGSALRETSGASTDPSVYSESEHICVLHDGVDDLSRRCSQLVRDAVAAGFSWIGILRHEAFNRFQADLEDRLTASGTIVSAEELLGLAFSPITVSSIAERLLDLKNRVQFDDCSRLLIILDMSWIIDLPSCLTNHAELEAAVQNLTTSGAIRIACLYDKTIFPPSILLDVLRTHTRVLHADVLCNNPYFVPPAVFLSDDPQQKLDWCLAMLPRFGFHKADCVAASREISAPGTPPCALDLITEHIQSGSAYNLPDMTSASTMSGHWKIRCLGELELYRHDGSRVEWSRSGGGTFKIKATFAYLMQRGARGASIEEIADLIWPKAHLTQSLNRLYHTIHCLRQLLLSPESPPTRGCIQIVCRNRRYYLSLPDGTWIDLPIFEQLCRQGEKLFRLGQFEQALMCCQAAERLYGGSLFSDIPPEYVENAELDWCWSQRFWIERMHLKILTYIAAVYRVRQDHELALRYCTRVLTLDPCCETAHQEAMRIYHAIGHGDAVERQYQLCRESLKRFEQRQPSTSTVSLARELIKGTSINAVF